MKEIVITRSEINFLNAEYESYISKLRVDWLAQNRVNSKDVYEVMSPVEQNKVHQYIDQWSKYVTPLAEAWWKQRGYGVIWPDNNSETMKVHRLEAV